VVLPILSAVLALVRMQYSEDYVAMGPILYTAAMLSLALHFEIGRRIQRVSGQ
jgi:hypothetical protein